MSLWLRLRNVFRGDRVSREIDEELEAHVEEAIEQGRDPEEARRAFGSALRRREECREVRTAAWLDSLRADAIFGWRRLRRNRIASAAAILSLALAIGACTAAFRLIDALLFRPLPIAGADRLYMASRVGVANEGQTQIDDSYEYPLFRRMREAVRGEAELIAISWAGRTDVQLPGAAEIEKAYLQHVSGWMFPSFGLRPVVGRLFTEDDDRIPGGHPYAVLSHDYWTRRFGRDPTVVGKSIRIGAKVHEIVGVVEPRFTGTETGTFTEVFVPMMTNARAVVNPSWGWFRTLVHVRPGAALEPVRTKLQVVERAVQTERLSGFPAMPQAYRESFVTHTIELTSAAAGASTMRKDFRRPLAALSVLVALVLLIACANVANLMTAQAAARAREMALRVSIGAGRARLVQLVLVESAWIALLATALGTVFARWSAPLVVAMINPPGNPARLVLTTDWRVAIFSVLLALAVTFLFGLAPALRASSVKPVGALKGGEDPHSRRRLMHALVAAQVAFCFMIHFVAGLFIATFEKLSHRPTGFSSERVLALDTVSERPQPPAAWEKLVARLRETPGVEAAALAGFAPMNGNRWNGRIALNGRPPAEGIVYFLDVSPGWIEAMKIPLLAGRDLRPNDVYPGAVLVNATFAKRFFDGRNPVGGWFERASDDGSRSKFEVAGLVGDARYQDLRGPDLPVAYVPIPIQKNDGTLASMTNKTVVIRTASADPLALGATLRREVASAMPGLRVSNLQTQLEIVQSHTVRERLLALLALFFAIVAWVLGGVGLYGVLNYSVVQRRREIGIRLAIGASAGDIARRVTATVLMMVATGAMIGVALGLLSVRSIESLLYEVQVTDFSSLAIPSATILAAAMLAALPAIVQAVRIDPVSILRSE